MIDEGGFSTHKHSGGLLLRTTWEAVDTWPGMTPGSSTAWVDTGSYAVLATGAVCYSAGPSDSITIY
jgi:hypothetical protein